MNQIKSKMMAKFQTEKCKPIQWTDQSTLKQKNMSLVALDDDTKSE